jgi:hypothetical protein
MEQYSYRVRASSRFSDATEALTPHRVDHFTAVLAAISAGRRELLRMHRANDQRSWSTALHQLYRADHRLFHKLIELDLSQQLGD